MEDVDITTQETLLAMNMLTLTPAEENPGLTPDYNSTSPDGDLPPTPPGSPLSQIHSTLLRRRIDTTIALRGFPQLITPPIRLPKSETNVQSACLRVLLVDDNAVNLRILERLLKKNLSHIIYQVDVAHEATQALGRLSTTNYDLVMMDIEMPGMSGLEATSRIRAGMTGERHRSIPVVAVTTKYTPYWRSLYLENGMVS
jgi:CheY-like chemotaxis protein